MEREREREGGGGLEEPEGNEEEKKQRRTKMIGRETKMKPRAEERRNSTMNERGTQSEEGKDRLGRSSRPGSFPKRTAPSPGPIPKRTAPSPGPLPIRAAPGPGPFPTPQLPSQPRSLFPSAQLQAQVPSHSGLTRAFSDPLASSSKSSCTCWTLSPRWRCWAVSAWSSRTLPCRCSQVPHPPSP